MANRVTKEVLIPSIANYFNIDDLQKIKVNDFKLSDGSNKGDNYACVMKSVKVSFEVNDDQKKEVTFMVKCMPEEGNMSKRIRDAGVFAKEADIYTKILPGMNKLSLEKTGKEIKVPKVFFANEDVIVMENLKLNDFRLVGDKEIGLSESELELALEQLALTHVAGYQYIEQYPGGVEMFKKDFKLLNHTNFYSSTDLAGAQDMQDYLENIEKIQIAIVEEHTNDQDLIDRVKAFTETRKEKHDPVHWPQGKFNCILHNDFWFNNMMFRFENGKSIDIRVLDWQMCRRARSVLDLAYMFGSSTLPSWRQDNLVPFAKLYYGHFARYMKDFGYDAEELYPWQQMIKDLEECYIFMYMAAMMHAMIHLTPPNEEGAWDNESMPTDDPEALAKFLDDYRLAQINQAKKNVKLRNRLIQLAEEARRNNVI